MKNIISILAVSLLLFSCNTGSKTNEEAKVLSLETLDESAENLNNELVSIEGMVTHVCKHGGQKMFITDASQNLSVLILVSNSIPEFDVALEGSNVQVTGKMVVSLTADPEKEHKQSGEGAGEGVHSDEADCPAEIAECPTEEAQKEKSEEAATGITYHVEALSFKEI